ncbi:MAG: hypothetical protein HUN04_02925 [Desulfobacter sp.]|nr:MAG: hypothetical protein HUN04_02925 [Desulfobacter sp.]
MKLVNCRFACLFLGLALGLCLVPPQAAMAHRVLLFGWVEEGMVHAEGGFGGGKPAKGCVLKAFDSEHTLVFTGKTDDQGRCAFEVPKGHAGEMILEMEAGPGHKGSWTVGADEFTAAAPTPAAEVEEHHKDMEKGPDFIKILAGIGVIFGLALAAGLLKKKKAPHA